MFPLYLVGVIGFTSLGIGTYYECYSVSTRELVRIGVSLAWPNFFRVSRCGNWGYAATGGGYRNVLRMITPKIYQTIDWNPLICRKLGYSRAASWNIVRSATTCVTNPGLVRMYSECFGKSSGQAARAPLCGLAHVSQLATRSPPGFRLGRLSGVGWGALGWGGGVPWGGAERLRRYGGGGLAVASGGRS